MAVQTAATLKGYFNTGDTPTEAQFADLIDSSVNEAYSLPTASTTVLGGVKVDGTTISIADGVISSSGSGMTNPMTTAGDIIVGGTNGAPTRLAKGTDGQVLTLASGNPAWAAASGGSLLVAETIVNGSPVTSVTFSGLDGNAAGGYMLDILWIYNGTPANQINLLVNNFMALSDYRTGGLYSGITLTTNGSLQSNAAWVAYAGTNGVGHFASANIGNINNRFMFNSKCVATDGTNTYAHFFQGICNQSVSNINTLTLSSSATAGIGIGSTFRLYRRK